jgi:hypothetical protein
METQSVNGDLTCYRYPPSTLSIALCPNTALLMISHFESTHPHTCCTSHSRSYSSECISCPFGPTRRPCTPAGVPPNSRLRMSYHQPPRQPQFHFTVSFAVPTGAGSKGGTESKRRSSNRELDVAHRETHNSTRNKVKREYSCTV